MKNKNSLLIIFPVSLLFGLFYNLAVFPIKSLGQTSPVESGSTPTPGPKYLCDANWKCQVDKDGNYPSLDTCNASCQRPARHDCYANNATCVENAKGSYSSIQDCLRDCPDPKGNKYSCEKSNSTCVLDPKGIYTSKQMCEFYCKPRYCTAGDYGTCSSTDSRTGRICKPYVHQCTGPSQD